eukprot:scaffold157425_cov24-Cyclotella_meneghiniana.AAC.2
MRHWNSQGAAVMVWGLQDTQPWCCSYGLMTPMTPNHDDGVEIDNVAIHFQININTGTLGLPGGSTIPEE